MQSITGNRPVCTQAQRGIVSGESTSNEDHTWLLNPGTQNLRGLQEFKNISAIKQCGFTKTELEMDKKIKENKAKLQKKLQKLEEKLKQNNLREPADTLEGERANRERAETRSKLPELQGRGPASDDGMMVTQENRQDVKEDEKEVVQYLQLQGKEDKTPQITFHVQTIVGELPGEEMSPEEEMEEPLLPPVWSLQSRITDEIPNDFQLLPCTVCNRSFESKRLEAHIRICRKVSLSQRLVYDGKRHRTKGTELEQFLKTHREAEATKVGWQKDSFSPVLVLSDFFFALLSSGVEKKTAPKTNEHSAQWLQLDTGCNSGSADWAPQLIKLV